MGNYQGADANIDRKHDDTETNKGHKQTWQEYSENTKYLLHVTWYDYLFGFKVYC